VLGVTKVCEVSGPRNKATLIKHTQEVVSSKVKRKWRRPRQ
jgi:hypothetical protein